MDVASQTAIAPMNPKERIEHIETGPFHILCALCALCGYFCNSLWRFPFRWRISLLAQNRRIPLSNAPAPEERAGAKPAIEPSLRPHDPALPWPCAPDAHRIHTVEPL